MSGEEASGRSLRGRLVSGGLWTLGGKVATIGASVLVNALLARLLGPAEFGVYVLAFSVVQVGAMLVMVGQNQAIVRLVAEAVALGRPGRARSVIGLAYRYTLAGIAVFAGVMLAGGGRLVAERVFQAPALSAVIGLVAAWTGLLALLLLTAEVFRGLQDLRLAAIFGGAASGLATLVLLAAMWLVRGQAGLSLVITAQLAAVAGSLVAGLVVLWRRLPSLGAREALRGREIAAITLPIWVATATSFAMQQADIWILGALRTTAEVGVYGASARLVALVVLPLLLINLVVPPVIAETYARGERERLQRLLRNAAALCGGPAFLVLVAFLVAGGPILAIVFGEDYRAGAPVLALLSLGKLVVVWTGSCGVTMTMTGHQTAHMRITLVSTALTVGAALLLVGPYGAVGVAAAAAGGTVVQNLAMWLAARRCTGIWTHVGIPRARYIRALFARRGQT